MTWANSTTSRCPTDVNANILIILAICQENIWDRIVSIRIMESWKYVLKEKLLKIAESLKHMDLAVTSTIDMGITYAFIKHAFIFRCCIQMNDGSAVCLKNMLELSKILFFFNEISDDFNY